MNFKAEKVKLLEVKPHKVRVQYVATGRIAEFAKNCFFRRLENGLLEITNPQAIPSGL